MQEFMYVLYYFVYHTLLHCGAFFGLLEGMPTDLYNLSAWLSTHLLNKVFQFSSQMWLSVHTLILFNPRILFKPPFQ